MIWGKDIFGSTWSAARIYAVGLFSLSAFFHALVLLGIVILEKSSASSASAIVRFFHNNFGFNEVGGDFFDYVWLDAEKTKFGIAMADVSGKAMKAAMTAVMTSGMIYNELTEQLLQCDIHFFYTDGFPEAMNENKELFGFERLEKFLRELKNESSAKEITDHLLSSVEQHAGTAPQHDDMTVVVVKVKYNDIMINHFERTLPMESEKRSIQLHIPSKLGFEKVAMDSAPSVANIMGFSADRINDLKTAISEACVNAIEHGNKEVETEKVIVTLTIDETKLKVDIRDKGETFTPNTEKPDIRKKIEGELPARGWGMFLIKSLVDEVEFTSQEGGNVTTMAIYLHNK